MSAEGPAQSLLSDETGGTLDEGAEEVVYNFCVEEGWDARAADRGYWRDAEAEAEIAAAVARHELLTIDKRWVSPPCYARARAAIRRHHLLVLRGPPGIGRRTAALRMLRELGHDHIWEFDPTVDPLQLSPGGLSTDGGFVATMSTSAPLSDVRARQLCDVLAARGCRLVLLAVPGIRAPTAPLPAWWCEFDQPPAPADLLMQMVQEHLAGRQPSRDVDTLLGVPEIRTLIAPGRRNFPAEVTSLGQALARVAAGDLGLDEALGALKEQEDAYVEEWFTDDRPAEQVITAIVLATLGGAALDELIDACTTLEHALRVPPADAGPRRPFASRQDRFDRAGAVKIRATLQTEMGPLEVVSARYEREGRNAAILRHVSRSGGQELVDLLSWMQTRADVVASGGRAALAHAAVELLRCDTATTVRMLLAPWAKSSKPRTRRLAADVLALASHQGIAEEALIRLVVHWGTQEGNLELGATAALACGPVIGRRYPPRALALLGRILQAHGEPLGQIVESSMLQLLAEGSGDPTRIRDVLDTMLAWSDPTSPSSKRQLALAIFIRFGRLVTRDGDSTRALFPWGASRSTVLRAPLAELLRRALRASTLRKPTTHLLTSWIGRADFDLEARAELIVLLSETFRSAANDHERGRVLYELRRVESITGASPTLADLRKEIEHDATA